MLLAVLPLTFLASQNCEPDLTYQDSTGVFPQPFHPTIAPDGGISECAVIGENYEFVFTVGVSDSIQVGGVSLPLDKIEILSVTGLPEGVNHVCEPADCVYENNTLGCAKLTGIPTSANAPGDYDLVINAKIYFALVFLDPIEISFPDSTFAPGKYTVKLLADSSEPCDLVSTNEFLREKVKMGVSPNPADGLVNIEINAGLSGDFNLRVLDLLGKSVDNQQVRVNEGYNRFAFDSSLLANGLYIIVLENHLGTVAQKMTVQH